MSVVVGIVFLAVIGLGSPVIRILPLGDSITDGYGVPGGYRTRLYRNLASAGYQFDFVGSYAGNGHPDLPDPDHEGHIGFRIENIGANITSGASWLNANPDVILLMIGANDLAQNYDIPNLIPRFETLISRITARCPNARLLVGNQLFSNVGFFNDQIPRIVREHRLAGEKINLVDLNRVMVPGDLPDGVHPSLSALEKIADQWFAAIQLELPPAADAVAPAQVLRAEGGTGGTNVTLTFTRPLPESVVAGARYELSGGLILRGVRRGTNDPCKVELATSAQSPGKSYRVTSHDAPDSSGSHGALAPDSRAIFRGFVSSGILNNVPEAADYRLVYALDIPDRAAFNATGVTYDLDHRDRAGSFSRIAYYVELKQYGGTLEFLYVSMCAFTDDVNRIGVPSARTGALFQQYVTNMTVVSSVPEIVSGVGLTGNIEFWPGSYSTINSKAVPNARDQLYDFGDTPVAGDYGSMQIHNPEAQQVLFAYNHWGDGGAFSDLGLGNNPGRSTLDWTFMNNANGYEVKRLQVLVLSDLVPLRFRREPGRVRLSWPAGFTNGLLQSAAVTLSAENQWLPATNAVVLTDGRFEAVVSEEDAPRFFRLAFPRGQ